MEKYKELMKKVVYENMKLQLGEDPRLAYKKKLIEQENKNKR